VHYTHVRPPGDASGVRLRLTDSALPFSAGMMMYASYFQIPPRAPSHLVPVRCCYSGFEPARGFAFRVHTHELGRCAAPRDGVAQACLARAVSVRVPRGELAVRTAAACRALPAGKQAEARGEQDADGGRPRVAKAKQQCCVHDLRRAVRDQIICAPGGCADCRLARAARA